MNHIPISLYTKSYDIKWNRIVHLRVIGDIGLPHLKDKQTCKMILFEKGSGIIGLNHTKLHIVSPSLLCCNQTDILQIEENHEFQLKILFFHPMTLNDVFTYEFLSKSTLSALEGSTLYQDLILLNSFYGINQYKRTMIILSSLSYAIIKSLMDKIDLELVNQRDGFWPCRSRSFFIELLFFLESTRQENCTQEQGAILDKKTNKLVHDIISYLSRNINNKVTLEQLEREFGTNRNKINIEFQKEMNTTVMKYFILLRMQLAANIIRDTEIPITEVALRVGYCDVSHFSRCFKEMFGKSPREYHATMKS